MINMKIKKDCLMKHKIFLLVQGLLFTGLLSAQVVHTDSTFSEKMIPIAYGERAEWEMTGAISSVKGDEMSKSFTTNVANTLYARLPGLTVGQQSGEPGNDAPTLHARGISTFGTGRDVTIIIDGFPSTLELFQQLTPQEIESVNLLKDAASAAIYGNKAANGVLLVKTKRGVNAPLELKLGIRFGMQQAMRLPDFLGSYDYAQLYNEAMVNDLGPGSEVYSPADLEAYKNGTDKYRYPNVNWYNQLLRTLSPLADYDLSARGGSDVVRYFVLLNVATNKRLYKGTEKESDYTKDFSYTRYNFRTNVDVKLSKRISSEFTLGGSVEDRVNPGRVRNDVSGEYSTNVFNLIAKLPPNAFPIYHENGQIGGNSAYYNPWAEITETGYYSTNKRSAQLSAKLIGDLGMITPGLSISGAVGFNTIYKSYTIASRDYARYDMSGQQFGETSSMSISESAYNQWRNFVVHGFVNYDRVFGEHHVDAMLMGGYEEYNVSSTDLPYKDIVSGGRLTYSYDKRYVAEFSFAYSGNDNYARGKRFGFFPAGSLGYVISNEEFLKGNKIVDYLKLRASYGLTGNRDNGSTRFPYNQYYTGGNYYLGQSNAASYYYVQNYYANPDATWEKDRKFNIGIDAVLFDRLSITADYFKEKRYDILTMPYDVLPSFVGFKRPELNIGRVSNQGFEAVVRYTGKETKDLTWFVEASAWFARNKILYNAEAPQNYAYQYRTGHRVDQPFLLEALGFFNDQNEIDSSPKQTFAAVQPGDLKYADLNNDKRIDSEDFKAIGYTDVPECTLGLHAGLTYKGFDFDVLFQGALNRSVYWSGSYFEAFQNDGQISSIALNRWTEDTKSTATYPRLSASNNLNNYQSSSFWQKNGDFLKLRSLEIGYTIPKNLTRKIKIEGVRVFMNGTNLFSLDHMDGFTDPETMTGYPAMRTVSLGLSVQL